MMPRISTVFVLTSIFAILSVFTYLILPHMLHSPPGVSLQTYIRNEMFKRMYKYAQRNGKLHLFRKYLRYARLPAGVRTSEELLALRDSQGSTVDVQVLNMTYGGRTADTNATPPSFLYKIHAGDGDDAGEKVTVQLRIMTPKSSVLQCPSGANGGHNNADRLPVVVYYHGGGWSLNDLDIYDSLNRRLAEIGPYVLVAVDYRKAPEYPFPAPFNDCLATLFWTWRNVEKYYPCADVNKLVIAGDSAGGNIAAGVALYLRDLGTAENARNMPQIRYQLLFYPSVYYMPVNPRRFQSYVRFATTGFIVDAENVPIMLQSYVGPKLASSAHRIPYISPLTASKSMVNLPDTLLITAEYDILRDEGRLYAEELREAGVSVTHRTWPGTLHGFLGSAPEEPMKFIRDSIASHFAKNIYVNEEDLE